MGRLAKVLSGQCQPGLKAFKKGGKVVASHDDIEEDKKLVKSMVKKDALAAKKGGKVVAKKCGCKVKK